MHLHGSTADSTVVRYSYYSGKAKPYKRFSARVRTENVRTLALCSSTPGACFKVHAKTNHQNMIYAVIRQSHATVARCFCTANCTPQ